MSLITVQGSQDAVNYKIITSAVHNAPSLIIDCANVANPHAFFEDLDMENLHKVMVINVDSLYRFRDTIRSIPRWQKHYYMEKFYITAPTHLFEYGDEQENKEVYEHIWKLLQFLGKSCTICIGVPHKHNYLAEKYANNQVVI